MKIKEVKIMKKLWESYLAIAPDLNALLISIDLSVFCGFAIGIALILLHNNGIF